MRWRERIRYRQSYRSSVGRSQKIVKLAKLAFLGTIGLVILFFIGVPIFSLALPSPDKIVRTQGYSTQILDRNGQVLYDIYANQKRTPVNLEDMPLYLRQATIAIEDKNFYVHQGFDPLGTLRGLSRIVTRGRAQGGSTLTQQLIKNALLTSDRSVIRKFKEFILAIEIERKYSKDQILQMYLNEVPYGGTSWGVGAAAQTYFGKDVKDLNLVESAILAGMPQSPSNYSPYSGTPKAYVARTKEVLRRMREDNYITIDQEKQVLEQLDDVTFQPRGASLKAPHFVAYVEKILNERYGANVVETGGLKITTTLDLDLQEKAQSIVTEEIAKVEKQHITNGATVVIAPETGEILAMVGSKDFSATDYDGQVNVTMSLRQPGSSFKPFTYVTGFKKGYTAATLLMDVPTKFPGGAGQPDYEPVNYDGKYKGPVQVRYALANSLNIPAVKMLAMVGIKDVLETATDLGITTLPPTADTLKRVGLSLTLGGGEVRLLDMAAAYSPFVNKGYRVEPVSILKVTDVNGKVLEDNSPKKGKRVLSEEQSFLISSILSDNEARSATFGTNSSINYPNVMAKTGTTNDRRDNWTVGGNANAMVGVWVGNNDNSPMLSLASGISGAAPIWRKVLVEALKGKPEVKFEEPGNITKANVDKISGYASHDGFPERSEYFVKGTEPGQDSVHVNLKVCKSDGKLANPSDIAANNYDNREFFVFKDEWQEGITNWINGQNEPKYRPPTDYCGTSNPLNVDFTNPIDRSSNLPQNFTVTFNANSSSSITQAKLFIDGAENCNFNNGANNYKCDVSLTTGVHELKAEALDSQNHKSDRIIKIGVGVPWDFAPSPTP